MNQETYTKYVRPIACRIIAVALMWFATWSAQKLGIPISDETQKQITEFLVILLGYAILHKTVDGKLPTEVKKDATP